MGGGLGLMGDDKVSEPVTLLTRVRAHVVAWMVEWAITGLWPTEDIKDLMDALEDAFDMDFEEDAP